MNHRPMLTRPAISCAYPVRVACIESSTNQTSGGKMLNEVLGHKGEALGPAGRESTSAGADGFHGVQAPTLADSGQGRKKRGQKAGFKT